MNLNKFTVKAQESIESAVQLADQFNHQEISPAHIMAVLVKQQDSVIPTILNKLEINSDSFYKDIEDILAKKTQVSGGMQKPYLSHKLNKIFSTAQKEADRLKDEYLSTEHIFLSTLKVKNELTPLYEKYNITEKIVLKIMKDIRGNQRITDQNPEAKYQVLEKYARNITDLASEGKLDPVIGRDEEIRSVCKLFLDAEKIIPF